jgi:hypothetical protein
MNVVKTDDTIFVNRTHLKRMLGLYAYSKNGKITFQWFRKEDVVGKCLIIKPSFSAGITSYTMIDNTGECGYVESVTFPSRKVECSIFEEVLLPSSSIFPFPSKESRRRRIIFEVKAIMEVLGLKERDPYVARDRRSLIYFYLALGCDIPIIDSISWAMKPWYTNLTGETFIRGMKI